MDMIGHATDSLWERIETFGDTTEVGVEFGTPRGGDHGFPVLGGKDEVVMKAGVCGWHGGR